MSCTLCKKFYCQHTATEQGRTEEEIQAEMFQDRVPGDPMRQYNFGFLLGIWRAGYNFFQPFSTKEAAEAEEAAYKKAGFETKISSAASPQSRDFLLFVKIPIEKILA